MLKSNFREPQRFNTCSKTDLQSYSSCAPGHTGVYALLVTMACLSGGDAKVMLFPGGLEKWSKMLGGRNILVFSNPITLLFFHQELAENLER